MKTSSKAVEPSQSTSQSDSIVRQMIQRSSTSNYESVLHFFFSKTLFIFMSGVYQIQHNWHAFDTSDATVKLRHDL